MKLIKGIGALACILIIMGAVFSILHLQSSKILFIFGSALFFIFLGLKSVDRGRPTKSGTL